MLSHLGVSAVVAITGQETRFFPSQATQKLNELALRGGSARNALGRV